jgi:hypothetical protein
MRASIDLRIDLGEGDQPLTLAALGIIAGALLSGPVGLIPTLIEPQPVWTDAARFIEHFRPWHQIPYWFGFVLIAGWVALNARLAAIAPEALRTRALVGVIATAAFATMITTNYVLQIAFVPTAVRSNDAAVAYFTMSNPTAVAWMIEMFGYGALGVASWVTAEIFPGSGSHRRWIVWLMVAQGVAGLGGAIATGVDVRWVLTWPGLAAYIGWNILVVVTAALIALEYWPRRRTRT